MRKISILGSTGSIGTQTLEVVREFEDLSVVALAVNKNIDLLEKQICEFHPELVCVYDEIAASVLKDRIKGKYDTKVLTGMDGLVACATIDSADIVVTAFVGMIGIKPTISAINSGKDIALANKETLVTAGHIIMPLAKKNNVKILPVDSEHSAIFQALAGNEGNKIHKIHLTASGGPFRGKTLDELKCIRPCDALKHPNWSMGRKITIDSSTMVNKGLEVMEAKWLYDVPASSIQVLIQPTSIIHSMVEFEDGAVIAQMGVPNMKLPIQYALFYPQRLHAVVDRLDFYKLGKIEMYEPDMVNFPGLKLGYDAINIGGSMPTIYNASNEWAVNSFLNEKIKYTEITEIIAKMMDEHSVIQDPSFDTILEVEKDVYEKLNLLYR